MAWDDDIEWLPSSFDDTPDPARTTIRLGRQIRFSLNCEHESHPEIVTFAEGAILGAMIQNTGVAVVRGTFEGHAFRFEATDYEVVR